MQLRRYFGLFLRWLWLIVLGMSIAGGAVYVTSKRTVPIYEASTTLILSQSKAAVFDMSQYLDTDRVLGTFAELLRQQPVMDEVATDPTLGLTGAQIAGMVSVTPIRNTQMLELSVMDIWPWRAAAIANTVPIVFRQQNEALQNSRFAASKASLKVQMDDAEAKIASTQAEIASQEKGDPPDPTKLDRLRWELSDLQRSYTSVFNSYADLNLQEAKQLDTLLVTQPAQEPTSPVLPKTFQNTLMAVIVGAMLAAGVALLVEYLEDILKNPDDVRTQLGLTTLGAVPKMKEVAEKDDLVMLSTRHSAATEAYRVLRTNLQFAAVDRPLRSLLVTSAAPSEGKSLTAANLAVALAQAGQRVILVDADLHRPRQHRLFKIPNSVGITSALVSPAYDLNELLQGTEVPGLRVLTAGPHAPNPAELLGSERMKALLANLKDQAEIVVLDSPPTMAVADAAILATNADGVLLLLDASKTRRGLAKKAVESLQQVKGRIVGAVLNRMPTRGVEAHYYYYYYHYNQHYGSQNGHGKRSHDDQGRNHNGADPAKKGIVARWRQRTVPK